MISEPLAPITPPFGLRSLQPLPDWNYILTVQLLLTARICQSRRETACPAPCPGSAAPTSTRTVTFCGAPARSPSRGGAAHGHDSSSGSGSPRSRASRSPGRSRRYSNLQIAKSLIEGGNQELSL